MKYKDFIPKDISTLIVSTLTLVVIFSFSYQQHKTSLEQIRKNEYEKLYSDVAKGHYNGEKLEAAIKTIIAEGDDLSGVDLSKKYIEKLKLKEQNLYGINFSESYLRTTLFKKGCNSKMYRSDFSGSNLIRANFQKANLMSVIFTYADLGHANFEGADLSFANLMNTYLEDTDFKGADLEYANFEGAKCLTVDQLCQAKTLYRTKLDPELLEQIQKNCPKLLEEPERIKY